MLPPVDFYFRRDEKTNTSRVVCLVLCLLCRLSFGEAHAPTCLQNESVCDVLKWRGAPYKLTDPKFARTIYGGKYVTEAFNRCGFVGSSDGEDWDVLWTHRPQEAALMSVNLPARSGVRLVNHCNYFQDGGNKCKFARRANFLTRKRADEANPRHLRIYELDEGKQLVEWKRAVNANPEEYWVLKPCFGGGSKGVEVHRGREAVSALKHFDTPTVAQEYVAQPYLGLGGRKFHLRHYILVTRWTPTGAYLFNDALIFQSRHQYNDRPSIERDIFSGISEAVEGVPQRVLWDHLDIADASLNLSAGVRARIEDVFREFLGTEVEEVYGSFSSLEARRQYSCFDLFGVDTMLDAKLQPRVMEINVGPNLWVDNHGQDNEAQLRRIKVPLVDQVLRWAALRTSRQTISSEEAEEIEAFTLQNFTRLL